VHGDRDSKLIKGNGYNNALLHSSDVKTLELFGGDTAPPVPGRRERDGPDDLFLPVPLARGEHDSLAGLAGRGMQALGVATAGARVRLHPAGRD
jgi:hypothetical protein